MQSIGKPFTELKAVDSTNNYAMAQAQNGSAKHGHAWLAHHQTAGKGSRGKTWSSAAGENIMLSVLLRPENEFISHSFYLTATIALAAYDLVKKYAADSVSIKWPNDIYWRDRKAAGILIENSLRGSEWQWCVAGIGMNINQTQFDTALPNPVSLQQITGKSYHPVALAVELCDAMQQRYVQWQTNKVSVLNDYNSVLYRRNEMVRFKKAGAVFSSRITEVKETGKLQIDDGMQTQFAFGEVEWMLPVSGVES